MNKIKSILTTKQKRIFWFVLFAAVIAAILENLSVSVIIPLVDVMLMPEKLFQYSWLKPVLFFSYSEDMPLVLDCLNLLIQKNKTIALIGESGVGKSTLPDIILGILPLQQGEIMIDGISIQDIPNRWSELIGFVPQTIYLMDASIAQNIAFGVSKDEFDHKQIEKVLEMANLKEFVETLPKKDDTIVCDRGVRFSGGQRQRIGIARALYHNPEILVLDEATSALDNTTEQAVMEAIESLQGNITV